MSGPLQVNIEAYELVASNAGFKGLRRTERPKPIPGPGQVLVRLRAASLNSRDLAIAGNRYFPVPVMRNTIPLSDGAGEVEAIGDSVRRFAPGDRVVAAFKQAAGSLGVPLDGTLTQYAVFSETGLLPIPENLSFEEAATLPVAAVTAWNAICGGRPIRAGECVLTLGVGGVAIFALQIAKTCGARVIVVSSDDRKLEKSREIGADEVVNRVRHPQWASAVLELTGGAGVEKVVELFGAETLEQSYQAVAAGGEIALVSGSKRRDIMGLEPHPLIWKSATLRGVACGNTDHFERVNALISHHKLTPIIDSVYSFQDAELAYQSMHENRHVGKIVIVIQE